MNYQRINNLTGWAIWLIATIVYFLTIEPTSSFWDCGEFIASAYKLQVGHPPGAPFFMMVANVFSQLAPAGYEATAVNVMSALCSSFTILFLFWSITHLGRKLARKEGDVEGGSVLGVMVAGAIGALAYTFSDSFWFSAVEGEVYAMSSLFTAAVFWAILKWESLSDRGGELRWIILIAYLMGLSIGVHLLNLLAIPAIAFVYYFKKYKFSWAGAAITLVVSLVILGIVQTGVIQYSVKLAGSFELLFVNSFGMGFNTGIIAYAILLIGGLGALIWFSQKKGMLALNTASLGITMLLIGYSTFALIVIRSAANPPMDENNPENIFALLSYLNREQYGDRPLMHGQFFNTPTLDSNPYSNGAKTWVKSFSVVRERRGGSTVLVRSFRNQQEANQYAQELGNDHKVVQEYLDSGEKKGAVPNYDPAMTGFFPRMYSSQANHIREYKKWSNFKGWNKTRVFSSPFLDQMMTQEEFEQHLDVVILGNGKDQAQLQRDLNRLFKSYGLSKPTDFFTVRSADEIIVRAPGSDQQQLAVLSDDQVRLALVGYLTDVLSDNLQEGRVAVQNEERRIQELEGYVRQLIARANATQNIDDVQLAESYQKTLRDKKISLTPSFSEDKRYFTSYQMNWMYFRYFLWNYAGKQNDIQGHGGFQEGNWLSGVDFIDEQRLGNRDQISDQQKSNKGWNRFYYLPLLFGLLGLVFHLVKAPKDFTVVSLLFLLTGVAIVVYLNQYPLQPRERDYAYVGSFYAFAIWIGLGAYALYDAARNISWKDMGISIGFAVGTGLVLYLLESVGSGGQVWSLSILYMAGIAAVLLAIMKVVGSVVKNKMGHAVLALLLALPAPLIMASEGWDDHSRAKRETGVDFAKNYLDSLEKDAIIFTNGDNDTFPLWYVQEVMGYRTDVRVVNLSLLNTDWYTDQMKRQAYDGKPVPFSIPEYQYRQGTRDIILLEPSRTGQAVPVDLDMAMETALDDEDVKQYGDGKPYNYLPGITFTVPVDSAAVMENNVLSDEEAENMVDNITWTITDGNGRPKSYILKSNLMVLDLIRNNDWKRPIYFAVTTGPDSYIGLNQYFRLEGLAYRLVPVLYPENENPNVLGGFATELMYDKVMNKFQWGNMDMTEGDGIYMDENNRRMSDNLRLQFSNLAEQLMVENKDNKAFDVLKKTIEVTPEKNVPYDRIMLPIIEGLYELSSGDSTKTPTAMDVQLTEEQRAEALELANATAQRLFTIFEQEMDYYMSLEPEYFNTIGEDFSLMRSINQRMEQVLRFYHPDDPMVQEFQDRLDSLDMRYQQKLTGVTDLGKVDF
ncbi:MAG: DUF2723 domain-containing protein [Flavobacteriales bacterium]|nr:DUF2723 domain-containing protein [Flavobacteriales bacterium]